MSRAPYLRETRLPLRYRAKRAWMELLGKSRAIYEAAEAHRLLADWITSLNTADEEVRAGIDRLRSRARDLERNNSTIRNYLRITAVNVIGANGMRLQSQVRNNDGRLATWINDRIEAGWHEWSRKPTIDGRQTLASFSRLGLKTICRDGEMFIRKWRGFDGNRFRFALEPIDADLLDPGFSRRAATGVNEIVMSVEIDGFGRPVAYHVRKSRYSSERERIPADQIIHLYDPDRVNQTRGVTWMTSVMVPIRQLAGYIESELVAARIGAAKMGFFQRVKDAIGPGALDSGTGTLATEANPGTFGVLPDGYEVASWNPDHPAAAFGAFLKEAKRDVATGVGVSSNVLTSDLENVNYSSMRSGLLLDRDVWRVLQQWWIDAFLWPVYEEWLNMALLSGAVALDSRDFRRFLTARWVPRGWAWVDPQKDVTATRDAISAGLTSRRIALAEQGLDLEDVFEQLAEEERLAEEYQINVDPRATAGATPASVPADEPKDEPSDEVADDEASDEAGDRAGRGPGHNGNGSRQTGIAHRLRRF
jgi:lambda family phage portal protein